MLQLFSSAWVLIGWKLIIQMSPGNNFCTISKVSTPLSASFCSYLCLSPAQHLIAPPHPQKNTEYSDAFAEEEAAALPPSYYSLKNSPFLLTCICVLIFCLKKEKNISDLLLIIHRLNYALTIQDQFPTVLISDLLNYLQKASIFKKTIDEPTI